ncbi:MAG: 50S ribosomal protein L3 [Candidatus Woesearchaeota archaeon]
MVKAHKPRSGSMQFWPRVRAKREYARVRSRPTSSENKLLGFAGYKVGMTHVVAADNRKTSPTKGTNITIPATIIECPPLRILGVRFYKKVDSVMNPAAQIMFKGSDDVKRKLSVPKKEKSLDEFADKISEFDDLTVVVHTSPNKTNIGKKKPEVFEIAVGGKMEEKFQYVKDNLGKDIHVSDVFSEGVFVDARGVTKGKGFQGPVKRYGIGTTSHKSEKDKRTPGSLGGWSGQQHFMYRVAHAGKMGYHARTEYNKLILKISQEANEVNPKGGFVNYGVVKNPFVLIKGSVLGPKKRMIRFDRTIRNKKDTEVPAIKEISLDSQQGN